MAYELTETEKRLGAIPDQMSDADQRVAASEKTVRAIGADRPAYVPQFGLAGTMSQTPEYQMARADRAQQAATGEFKSAPTRVDTPYGSNVTKSYSPSGAVTYSGVGSGASSDQQERDVEMKSRGMVKDYNGNWAPPGGWGGQAVQTSQSQPQPREDFSNEPDIGSMTLSQLFNYKRDLGNRRVAAKRQHETGLVGMKEEGALRRMSQEFGLRGAEAETERGFRSAEAATERGALAPYREAQARGAAAQAGAAENANWLRKAAFDKTLPEAERMAFRKQYLSQQGGGDRPDPVAMKMWEAKMENAVTPEQQASVMSEYEAWRNPAVKMEDGGFVEGYADGGAVGNPSTGGVDPMVMQYGQYLGEASKVGIAPVPFAQYINLMQSARSMPKARFADGGDVSALQRPLEGPGTGRSDSIPAVIDGGQPAALSRGEFVLDEETTKYYGTKFLKDLQRKAKEALTGEGPESASAAS